MVAASVSNELQRVVAIRESIKSVVSCAFRVNVLGLNALKAVIYVTSRKPLKVSVP